MTNKIPLSEIGVACSVICTLITVTKNANDNNRDLYAPKSDFAALNQKVSDIAASVQRIESYQNNIIQMESEKCGLLKSGSSTLENRKQQDKTEDQSLTNGVTIYRSQEDLRGARFSAATAF